MEVEDQVCSLELAKKLKELGVEQDSLFYWMVPKDEKDTLDERGLFRSTDLVRGEDGFVLGRAKEIGLANCQLYYSAFTVAGLLAKLPKIIGVKKRIHTWEYWLIINSNSPGWIIEYSRKNDNLALATGWEIQTALANMLIYLKENKLI